MYVELFRRLSRRIVRALGTVYEKTGIIDRQVAEETWDLALPMIVTSTLRTLLRTSDFFLVSLALGDAALAGLEFGFQYYFLTLTGGMVVANGSISVVSRFTGAGDRRNANFTVKQSLFLVLLFSAPIIYVTWNYADWMVGLLTNDPAVISQGATYLQITMAALAFRSWSLVALRSLQGAGDTLTPMLVRSVTLPMNIVLSAIFIFGLGPAPEMGIAGAALGLVIAQTVASLMFFGAAVSGGFAVHLNFFDGRWWDWEIVGELVKVGYPLAGRRLVRYGVRFPFLAILATLGTPIVAAFAVSRRIIRLARMPSNGIGTATSTLVGQALGAGSEAEAEHYGWQITWISLLTQGGLALVVMLTAPFLVGLFGVEAYDVAVMFVWMFGFATIAMSINRTMRGSLQAAGDTMWPFYGICLGSVFRLGLAFLSLPAGYVFVSVAGWQFAPGIGLGTLGIYASIVLDFYSRVGINFYRYKSGTWKIVARRSPVGQAGD